MGDWSAYYDHHEARPPRARLGEAVSAVLTRTDEPRLAADLGFGQGTETVALLEQGWRVLAVDAEPEAERRLRARVVPSLVSRLTVVTAPFSDVQLPSCDLVWAGLALPFCPADAFDDVWRRIRQAVMPGGVLAVDLFGPNHAWAARTTTVERSELDDLLASLEVLDVNELDEVRGSVSEGPIRWHSFSILARVPD